MSDAEQNFKHVQKLVKEGKISDHAASVAVAMGVKPKPVMAGKTDEELREQIEKIASFKFGPFKNTKPAKVALFPADDDHRSDGTGVAWSSYDAFIDDAIQIVHSHTDKAVAEARSKIAKQIWEDEQKANAALSELIVNSPEYVRMCGRIISLQRARDIAEDRLAQLQEESKT